VGDWFKDSGFSRGCSVGAAWFVKERSPEPVTWKNFCEWVDEGGGFLSEAIREEVKQTWNLEGNEAYSLSWGRNIEPVGHDEDGFIWAADSHRDFRKEILE
jgi:hypothetical protein